MPIVDIELVCESESAFTAASPRALADALGKVFGSEPGGTWVRMRLLNCAAYAENQSTLCSDELPAFVSVLALRPPGGEALAIEVRAVTEVVARCLARDPERVHVQYSPAAIGRQAFGGKLVA